MWTYILICNNLYSYWNWNAIQRESLIAIICECLNCLIYFYIYWKVIVSSPTFECPFCCQRLKIVKSYSLIGHKWLLGFCKSYESIWKHKSLSSFLMRSLLYIYKSIKLTCESVRCCYVMHVKRILSFSLPPHHLLITTMCHSFTFYLIKT